jgi:hypothetical protein
MNRTNHPTKTVAATAALGLAAVLTLGAGNPAAAKPTTTLFVGGGGIAELDDTGTLIVEGPALVQDKHLRDMLDATLRAAMAATDGTLPAIDECEPASATVEVNGTRDADMTLTSQGTVCHTRNPFFPTDVTIKFNGQHQVVDAKRPQLRGVTGTLSMTISPGGFTSIHADSFTPSPLTPSKLE